MNLVHSSTFVKLINHQQCESVLIGLVSRIHANDLTAKFFKEFTGRI